MFLLIRMTSYWEGAVLDMRTKNSTSFYYLFSNAVERFCEGEISIFHKTMQ